MNSISKSNGNAPEGKCDSRSFLLIDGEFSPQDALDILTRMVHVKIKYHESKIHDTLNEEDIKMREKRIVDLQRDLYEMRREIVNRQDNISLKAEIQL